VLGAPTDYPPMVIKRRDGTYVGVLVDLFEEIDRRLDSRVRLHIEDSCRSLLTTKRCSRSLRLKKNGSDH
jgi:hypothetical protein